MVYHDQELGHDTTLPRTRRCGRGKFAGDPRRQSRKTIQAGADASTERKSPGEGRQRGGRQAIVLCFGSIILSSTEVRRRVCGLAHCCAGIGSLFQQKK